MAMGKLSKSLAPAIAAVALLAGVPAQAACWTEEDAALARIHDLRTKLTVGSTRCEASAEVAAEFQSFARANRNPLAVVSQRLKSRFWTAYGQDEGQRLLDRFAEALVTAHKSDSGDCANRSPAARGSNERRLGRRALPASRAPGDQARPARRRLRHDARQALNRRI
jgi:hypothetical protein